MEDDSLAPLFVSLHPTQLYSSLLLFLIFLFLYYQKTVLEKSPGSSLSLYLLLISSERFIVDFWRGDRAIVLLDVISVYQCVAGALFVCAAIGMVSSYVFSKGAKL